MNRRIRINNKFQFTIPLEVRSAMKLKVSDFLVYEIKDSSFIIRTVSSNNAGPTKLIEAMFSEWCSPEDEEAFKSLQCL